MKFWIQSYRTKSFYKNLAALMILLFIMQFAASVFLTVATFSTHKNLVEDRLAFLEKAILGHSQDEIRTNLGPPERQFVVGEKVDYGNFSSPPKNQIVESGSVLVYIHQYYWGYVLYFDENNVLVKVELITT